MRSTRTRPRGVAALLAMLFLVLFSILALGFYATVSTAQQVAGGEQRVVHAFLASESGMEFMRYQMARVSIPGATADNALVTEAYTDLQTLLNGTSNMGSMTVGRSGEVISIPSGATQYINTDANSKFRATVTRSGSELVVKVTGLYGIKDVSRAIEMRYQGATATSTMFTYGVASSGGILMTKGTVTDNTSAAAGFLSTSSATPAITVTGGTIEGDLAVTTSTTAVVVAGASVGGTSNPTTIANEHTHVVANPTMPTFDTSGFAAYATNTWTSSMSSPFINCRVPAGSNPNFNGGAVIQGILYIEAPNKVKFLGNVTIKGLIVFQGTGTDTDNTMEFKGNSEMQALPSGAAYDALRTITGIGILAPTATVSTTGSADLELTGSLIASKFTSAGNSDTTINNGSLITTSSNVPAVTLSGSTLTFNGTGASNPPTMGVVGSKTFSPKPRTYLEVSP
ncbi:MAG: hypothetical protein ABIP55_13395 [Tepidisphaeraceae bacterium]